MKELKDLQEHLKVIHALYSEYDDICTLIEMVDEEEDRSMVKEIEKDIAHFEEDFEKLRIETLLSGEYDSCNAIMTLHAGTGGTEACDWVNMLYRMYTRWFQTKGFSVQVLDYLDGDITGIKNITFEVVGDNAYGYLKSEKGVHRLVRISPFNSAGKRQTSFASCDVVPDIEEDIDIDILDDDLKLKLLQEQEQAEKVSDIRGEVKDIGFGNQIRSYVMQPYTLVKDHRTNVENGNVTAVLDGDLDMFINAYLKYVSGGEKGGTV